MISRLVAFIFAFGLAVSVSLGSAFADVLRDDTVIIEAGTPLLIEELSFESAQTLELTLSEIEVEGSQVDGRLAIIKGSKKLFDINKNTPTEIDLAAGDYQLLAYAKLISGDVGNLVLEVEDASDELIVKETINLANQTEQPDNQVMLTKSFNLTSVQDLVLTVTDQDLFDPGNFLEPLQHIQLTIVSSGSGPLLNETLVTGSQFVFEFPLEDVPANETFTLAVLAVGAEGAVSNVSFELAGTGTIFSELISIDDVNPEAVADTVFVGTIVDLPAGQYEIRAPSLMDTDLTGYELGLQQGDEIISLNELSDWQLLNLSGTYQIRAVYPKDEKGAIGIRIKNADDNIVYSNVVPIGNVQLVDTFELTKTELISVTLQDLNFLNAMDSVDFLVTDGALQDKAFSYEAGTQNLGQLEAGTYFLLADAQTDGDAVVSVKVRNDEGNTKVNKKLYQGDNLFFTDQIEVEDGGFKFSLVDHQFPVHSNVLGMGIFKGNTNFLKFQLFGSASTQSESVDLTAGKYELAFIVGENSGDSLAVGYKVEQTSEGLDGDDRGVGSNSSGGGGGGGGGGSIPVYMLLAVFLLAGRRIIR